ncbi:type I secretion C-terminal target domain (VC_A0849 subclass), partial [Pseudomonas benzenivorans]
SYSRNPGTPGGVTETFTYTLTDGDSDARTANLVISIGNSTPTVDIPAAGGETTTVYEAGLPERNGESAGSAESADGDGTDNDVTTETVSGSIGFTALDGLSAVSLGGNVLTTSAQSFADGLTAHYSYDAVAGTGTIHYSYTLPDNTAGDATSVSFAVVVTDLDNDPAPAGNLVIDIVDDVPQFHSVMDAVLSSATRVAFDGLYDASFGADGLDFLYVALASGGSYGGIPVSFVQTVEEGVTKVDVTTMDGLNTVLFSFYYTTTTNAVSAGGNGSMVIEAFSDLASPATSEFFTLTVNPDGTYTFDMLSNTVISTTTVDGEDFDAFGPTFSVHTDDGVPGTPDLPSLTIYGSNGDGVIDANDQVNASALGIGVKATTINEGESLTLDFEKQQSYVKFSIQQFAGSGSALIMIALDGQAFDFYPGNTARDLTITKPGSGTAWVEVVVTDDLALIGTWNQTVTGTGNGEVVTYTLYVDSKFGDLQIAHVADSVGGELKFNINQITYDQIITVKDLSLNFELSVTDGDGDTSVLNDTLTISMLDPAEDVVAGVGGTDGVVLVGNGEMDRLIGGAGDDILIGELDSDIMTGGAGADTFKWLLGDDAVAGTTDTITSADFVKGFNTGGDRLDLSELLVDEHGAPGNIGNLLSYIDIALTSGDTVIKVSTSGDFNPADATGVAPDAGLVDQTIVLQDADLFTGYAGATESSVILGMLGDGTLKVDV